MAKLTLEVYTKMRKADMIVRIPEFDEWSRLDEEALRELVRKLGPSGGDPGAKTSEELKQKITKNSQNMTPR